MEATVSRPRGRHSLDSHSPMWGQRPESNALLPSIPRHVARHSTRHQPSALPSSHPLHTTSYVALHATASYVALHAAPTINLSLLHSTPRCVVWHSSRHRPSNPTPHQTPPNTTPSAPCLVPESPWLCAASWTGARAARRGNASSGHKVEEARTRSKRTGSAKVWRRRFGESAECLAEWNGGRIVAGGLRVGVDENWGKVD